MEDKIGKALWKFNFHFLCVAQQLVIVKVFQRKLYAHKLWLTRGVVMFVLEIISSGYFMSEALTLNVGIVNC